MKISRSRFVFVHSYVFEGSPGGGRWTPFDEGVNFNVEILLKSPRPKYCGGIFHMKNVVRDSCITSK